MPSLALIYSQINDLPENVRLAASLQLKHATDKHWKPRNGLSVDQKTSVKNIFWLRSQMKVIQLLLRKRRLFVQKLSEKMAMDPGENYLFYL